MENTDSVTKEQLQAGLAMVLEIGKAVKAAGPNGIPNGHLYAMVSSLGLTSYQTIIRMLKNAGAIEERGSVLHYIGKI